MFVLSAKGSSFSKIGCYKMSGQKEPAGLTPRKKWTVAGILLLFAVCMYASIIYKVSVYGP